MTEQTQSSKSGYLNAMIFTTSALLLLMTYAAGFGFLVQLLPGLVESGDMSLTAAWAAGITGGLAMLFSAIFTAHQAVAFVDIVTKHASRRQPPEPLPPLPKTRNLHVVHSTDAA